MAGDAAGMFADHGAGFFDDPHGVRAVFQAVSVCGSVAGGPGFFRWRRHLTDGAGLSQKLCGRVPGGSGDRAGVHCVLGLCLQRLHGPGQRLGGDTGVELPGGGHLQYAGAGGAGEGGRPGGERDVWNVNAC